MKLWRVPTSHCGHQFRGGTSFSCGTQHSVYLMLINCRRKRREGDRLPPAANPLL